jgi:hypothetical protein
VESFSSVNNAVYENLEQVHAELRDSDDIMRGQRRNSRSINILLLLLYVPVFELGAIPIAGDCFVGVWRLTVSREVSGDGTSNPALATRAGEAE